METHITTVDNVPPPNIEFVDPGKQELHNNLHLVASKDFKEGELVFIESVLIEDNVSELSPQRHYDCHNERWAWSIVEQILSEYSVMEVEEFLSLNFATIPSCAFVLESGDERALAYMSLTYPLYERDMILQLFNVVVTNNISSREGKYGFYMYVSRMNHACKPNTTLYNHKDDGSCHVFAVRDIIAGESLTRDYVIGTPIEQKRTLLFNQYAFICRCSFCVKKCCWLQCDARGPLKCPCQQVSYCSKEHQKLDWKRHKECEHLSL